uniref:Uncharacterized protein n=1 Tax=Tanacetum cinerariifolium TaxID=118510 RepID=A0A6L2NZ43_TANCI|nr:hypothetical protein [Tanacetum cinerariifolium]
MERVHEIKAEGIFILNPIPLILKPKRNPKNNFTISPKPLHRKPDLEGLPRPHQLILDKLELVNQLLSAYYKPCLCKGNLEMVGDAWRLERCDEGGSRMATDEDGDGSDGTHWLKMVEQRLEMAAIVVAGDGG